MEGSHAVLEMRNVTGAFLAGDTSLRLKSGYAQDDTLWFGHSQLVDFFSSELLMPM